MDRSRSFVKFLCLVMVFRLLDGKFIRFKPLYEYQYNFQSDSDVKDLGKFKVDSKISYMNIDETEKYQEILLRVYAFSFTSEHQSDTPGHDMDLSKWFSFEITPYGEILKVYHPKEDDEVLATKKGFAALLASKLRGKQQVLGNKDGKQWVYHTEEIGNEGPHNASYTVIETPTGIEFRKQRRGHPLLNSNGTFQKTLHFHQELGTIHKVLIEEDFQGPKTQPDFDPHYNMRKVKAINDFSTAAYPEMSAISKGKLEFLTRHKSNDIFDRPVASLLNGTIHLTKYERKKPKFDTKQLWEDLQNNVTCIRQQPPQGSPITAYCFIHLVEVLKLMSDEEIVKVANFYFTQLKPLLLRNRESTEIILDAFGALASDLAQQLLVEKVLRASPPDTKLILRLMTHISGMDDPPIENVTQAMEEMCFHPEKFPSSMYKENLQNRVLLALGSVAHKLSKAGQKEKATEITNRVHAMLGLHDPWLYRERRAVQTKAEKLQYDQHRVVLLETLGNARMDHSFDYIISHINTTNSPWIKRAGVHALRKYEHHMAADVLLNTAMYDEDENVRYEALLMYQAHPKSMLLSPMNARIGSNETGIIDPYASDMHVVGIEHRTKRGFFEGIHFRLQAPGIDWRKMLGTEDIGASFGIIIQNYLDLQIAPLKGHLKVNVQDEAYARVHLGMIGKNFDFFLARLCFKGRTEYNLNILQENDMKKVGGMAKGFGGAIKGIVQGIKEGIDLFKQIISGKLSIKQLVADFVDALEQLPKTVIHLREKAIQAVKTLGRIDEMDLPPFIRPVKKLVMHVQKLFNDIKTDVMTFYNTLEETITVIIPQNAKNVYDSIVEIIDSFRIIIKDPKTAITKIGKGAMTIYTSVMALLDAVNRTQEACFFLKDDKPYWFDLGHQFEIVLGLSKAASESIAHHSVDWVQEQFRHDDDAISIFTKGKHSTSALRKEITHNITVLVNDLLKPFKPLIGFIDPFLKLYKTVFGTIRKVKEAYDILKEGYQFARSIIDRIFGPKAHKEFPKDTRMDGSGCKGQGFYPAKMKGSAHEYWSEGVDLEAEYGEEIVAPFPGYIMRTDRDDEIEIRATGGSLQDVHIYITNIRPESNIQHSDDPEYIGKLISAGVKIGTASHSPACVNHIHIAFQKDDGFMDPTRFLEARPFTVPEWIQKCDDYKLVWKFETVAADCILCLVGDDDQSTDTSPNLENTDFDDPKSMDSTDDPGTEVANIKQDPNGMYSKLQNAGFRKKRSLFGGKNPFTTLLHKADSFFKKFSLKRLKLGTILNFIDKLGMKDSAKKMAEVMKTIKKIIDNKPCINPAQATDEQLVQELMERGKAASGSREDMIKQLTQKDNQCPLMSFTMPKDLVCTFDPMCMGVECCINVKLFMFLHTVKAYARFDPCQMEFHYGIDGWHGSIAFPKLDFDGIKKEIKTGIKLDILGGIEVIMKLEIQMTDSEAFATIGAGFCDQTDTSNCVIYIDLLKDAILPLPICHPDGTFDWPKVDWAKFFSKEAVLERLKNAGKQALKQAIETASHELLKALGLPQDLLLSTGPCPRPENMTKGQLMKVLHERGLTVTGTVQQLMERIRNDDRRCTIFGKDVSLLPEITNEFLKEHLYYSVSSNCVRIDACADFTLDLGPHIPPYTKAFKVFIDVDFCNFIVTVGFEKWKETLVLISYKWGTERIIPISNDIHIKLNIDKDDATKMFVIDFGLTIEIGGNSIIDNYLLENQNVPIPICNENFTLPGGGSFDDFLKHIGGKLTSGAFDLVLKELGLEKIFKKEKCNIQEGPKDCPLDINPQKYLPPSVNKMLRCEMPQNCFGLQCCLDLSFKLPFGEVQVSYSIPFWFKMSPCDFEIDVAFGPFRHKSVLLNYDWGTPGILAIGKGDTPPVTINYSVDKMGNGLGFIVDVRIIICLPLGDNPICIPDDGFHVLKHQEIPACSKNFTDMLKNFSISEIAKDFELDLAGGLKEGAVHFILERLGLEEFFSGAKCDKRRKPFSPSVQGWNNECPLSIFNLPNIEDLMRCHFTETCTGIECCVDIPYLGLTLKPFFLLNPCEYTLSYGINTINHTFSLFDYEWGKKEKISLANGVIQLEFIIKKPPEQKKFVIDLVVKACLEEGKPCEIDVPVFQATEVPQPLCDMEATLSLKNFSLTDWATQVGAELAGNLPGKFVKILLQHLGLDVKLNNPPCDSNSEKYSPAQHGWKSECPKHLPLPDLPSSLSCYVPDYCTGIDCCFYFDYLDLSLNIYLYIDTCNYVIKGGIEKFTFELPFFHYNWGEEKEERLQEVIRIKYKINKLSDQKKFIVDLEFSFCLEKDKCTVTLPLFTRQLMPQPFCDMNMNFSMPDISLSEWMKDKGLQLGQSLSTALANRLLDELGLSPFMNDEQCDRYSGIYAGSVDGWNSEDCPLNMTLPKIHSSVTCYIPDYCTGINCCVEVGKIGKSFNAYALLDGCNWKLSVGIEKRSFNISLTEYEWGKKEEFSLLNVVRLEFTIHDLSSEKQYMLNMNISVCLEHDGACLVSVPIFKNTKLPKLGCDWNGGFKIPDFSLDKFIKENNIMGSIQGLLLDQLLEALGITPYLKETPCSRQLPPFASSQSDGWNNECKLNLESRLPQLSGPVTCHLTDTCTGIQCCVEVKEISKSVDVYVILDACNYKFSAGIEKLTFNQSLLNYEFGKKESFKLLDVIRIEYTIDDLKGEKQFLVNMDISVCFEANGPCALKIPILTEVRLPKPLCNLESGFSFPSISLENFTQNLGLNLMDQLPSYAVDLLLEKMGVAQFLEETPCDRKLSPYSPAVNGWNKACPVDLPAPSLTGPLTCHTPDYCTGVECCVEVKPIRRSFHVYVLLDACSNRIKLGVERYGIDVSYLDYDFGTVQHVSLANVIMIDYSIYDLVAEKKFVVNMNVSVCLEPDSCVVNLEVLKEMYLPKIGCDWNIDFSGISVTDFLKEKGLSLGQQLSSTVISQVLERLGVTEYLENPQCDRHSSVYTPAKSGWKNDSPSSQLDLPELSGPVSCTLLSSCTAVDCCIYVDFLKRSFHAVLDIDMCSRKITLAVEKLKIDLSVLDYTWGVKDKYRLMDTVTMDYNIDNREDKNIFKVSLNISVGFDPGVNMFDWVLLQETPLPQIPCDWNTGFSIKDFSLVSWMKNINLPSGQQLSKIMASKLLEHLGIGSLMEETSCQRSGPMYSPATDGWKKDCPLTIPLTPLKIPATCMIPSHCTAVDCCIDVDFLGRSFHAYLDLDTCNNQFTVGIEKLKLDPVSLVDYKFGTTSHFNLKGAVRVTYKIEDMKTERVFHVNMNISICFEANGHCLYDVVLFNNVLVPKILCNWESGFSIPGFSLQKFVTDAGLSLGQTLTDSVLHSLYNQLGIASYLMDTPCQLSKFAPSKDGWKRDCKHDLVLPKLPDSTRCSIGESCTAVSCCMNVDFLKRAFNTRVEVDTCNYKLKFGIEKLDQEIDLFNYKWGTVEKKYLLGVVRIDFIVNDLVDDKQFQVTLNLSLCFEDGQPCLLTMNVLRDAKLPKLFCDWGTGFLVPDFSLKNFLESQGGKLVEFLPTTVSSLLMKTLGIDKFLLGTPCLKSSASSIQVQGNFSSSGQQLQIPRSPWYACPGIQSNPVVPSLVSCSVPSTYSAIDCCIDVKLIGRTINARISLDPCTYEIEIGIEKLKIKKSLLDYKWGEKETFTLQGGVKLQYRIDDLASEKMFMLDLSLYVCMEESRPSDCVVDIPILKNLKMPKPLCNWDGGFTVPKFSLNSWLSNNGIPNTAKLGQYVAQQIIRELGIDEYLNVPQCDRKTPPYSPSNTQGWNISPECPVLGNLPPLPTSMSCHITDNCTRLDCCVDVNKLGLSLNAYIVLDTCSNKFTVGVDKFSRTISLLNVGFGKLEVFSFLGLFKIGYKIDDFQSEKTFVVSVNVSVCLESNKPCDVHLEVVKNVKFPKPLCDFSGEFSIANFSLTTWMKEQEINLGQKLPRYAVDLLAEELGIAGYLQESQCTRAAYQPDKHGWNATACSKYVVLPALPVTMACSLPDYCTGIQCCTDIPLLGRSFEVHVLLDACHYKLSIGLEKLVLNISLFDYHYDTWKEVSLGNMLRLSYKIDDLTSEKMFMFDIKISACFESTGDCRYTYKVLENTKLPKQPCDWKDGFAVPGFKLNNWLGDKGLTFNTTKLSGLLSSYLLEDLGIAGYMLHPSCDVNSAKYIPRDGRRWKSDCSSNVDIPSLPGDTVCHLDSTCTGVSCCVDVPLIGKKINAYLTLDPCDYKLNLGIEKYQFEFSLLDFKFGEQKQFHISRVIEIDYKITDLPGEAAYYIDLDLRVCFNDGGPCVFNSKILSGTKLPKVQCGWEKGFIDQNWSLAAWYKDMSIKPGSKLPSDSVLILMDTLGVAEFLNHDQCDRHDPFSVYASQYEGWSTDCRSTSVVLPPLQDSVITCYMEETCRGVQCCLDVDFISRSLQVQVNFDPCSYLMTFKIEKLQMTATLNEYEWGKWKQIDLYGVVRIRFILHDLYAEDQYLLSMTLSLCWESHGQCQDHHIFKNARLPKAVCDWDMGYNIPDFSLKKFMTTEGLTKLTDSVISQMSEDLGLAVYLNSPTCDRTVAPYKSKVNGWNNECNTTVTSLEDISSHAACHIPDRCTAVDCCITLPSFKRNVNVFVDLDSCDYRLSVGIEKIHLNFSLVDYQWGTLQQYSLVGVVSLNFTIDDLVSDDVFVFNMNVSVCLESSGPCEVQLHVFKGTKLPKQTCNWNTDYKIKDFSLKSYLTELGLNPSLKKLQSHTTSELLHDLGIAPFLLDDPCDRGNLPYFPNKNGWNKGCPKPVSLSPLPNNTYCHIYPYCTGITCCTDVELISKTINTYITLDSCNRKMSVGIEKLSVNTSLFDYHYGYQEHVKLHGLIHLDYVIENLESERKFMVSLNLSICFESHGPCVVSIPVLKNTQLPKSICDWKSDFIDPNFSFESFLAERRLPSDHHLNTNQMRSLMDTLRITEFLQDTQCDSTKPPFSPSLNGWNNECKQRMSVLPNNTGPVTCNIHDTCTALDCCINAGQIGRSFRAFVNFVPCLYKLTVSIEQLKFDRLLFDFEWGQPVQVWLFGFVRMEFTIADLEIEGQYLIDMTLSVCLEIEGPCYVSVKVFNKYRLPKPQCDWNSDFFIKGFSYKQWMIDEKITPSTTLAPYATSKLLSDLNIAAYLKDEKCKQTGPLYTPQIDGWKNECPREITLPILPDNIVCHISNTCTDIDCCVYIPLLNKTFNFFLNIDPCYEQLSVGIEKMHHEYKLLNYQYGRKDHFNLLGVVRTE